MDEKYNFKTKSILSDSYSTKYDLNFHHVSCVAGIRHHVRIKWTNMMSFAFLGRFGTKFGHRQKNLDDIDEKINFGTKSILLDSYGIKYTLYSYF